MSVDVMSRVWKQADAKGSDLLLLLALADYANNENICWPSQQSIADKIRMSDRQTRRMIEDLQARGLIFVAAGSGRGINSRYAVLAGLDEAEIIQVLRREFAELEDAVTLFFAAHGIIEPKQERPARSSAKKNQHKGGQDDHLLKRKVDTFASKRWTDSTEKVDMFAQKVDIAVSNDPSLDPSCDPSLDPPPSKQEKQEGGGAIAAWLIESPQNVFPKIAYTFEEHFHTCSISLETVQREFAKLRDQGKGTGAIVALWKVAPPRPARPAPVGALLATPDPFGDQARRIAPADTSAIAIQYIALDLEDGYDEVTALANHHQRVKEASR